MNMLRVKLLFLFQFRFFLFFEKFHIQGYESWMYDKRIIILRSRWMKNGIWYIIFFLLFLFIFLEINKIFIKYYFIIEIIHNMSVENIFFFSLFDWKFECFSLTDCLYIVWFWILCIAPRVFFIYKSVIKSKYYEKNLYEKNDWIMWNIMLVLWL